ncbi:hypothetical protein FHR99_001581 [Litorivivens lipolytica]|uniref:Uncharacterized protein n=1 Tax=Litorivivens lipolytica TaxID=1524264 RepID=A0A7W4Z6V4_9GAMM|nr:hypothetical protein [Litorivivens lipolytica]MBB3047345.1 hypothetical protein [Litorivivens lipolytica]
MEGYLMQPEAISHTDSNARLSNEALVIEAAYRADKPSASVQWDVNHYHSLTDTVHRENLDILRQLDS